MVKSRYPEITFRCKSLKSTELYGDVTKIRQVVIIKNMFFTFFCCFNTKQLRCFSLSLHLFVFPSFKPLLLAT